MIRRTILFGAAMLPLPLTAAFADPRVATRPYRQSEIVVLNGRAGVESTIAFADDERIENVAVGDSGAWQVTPNKRADLLFVKPAAAGKRTNMTVVTDRHTYLFDLVAARAEPVYLLRFSYPDAPKPAPAAVTEPAVVAVAATPPPPAPEPDPASLNFAWVVRGDKALLPARVFDDGRSTFLQWGKDAPLPAILVRAGDGAEGPVNYTTRGPFIVVDGVPATLVLRTGKQVALLSPVSAPSIDYSAQSDKRALADAQPSRPFSHVLDGRP